MKSKKPTECWGKNGCKEPVAWVRCTQFSGDHPFCAECAPRESNFGDNSNSHWYWCTIEEY